MLGDEEEVKHKTKYTYGRASYIEKNQSMINDSDYCVFYYDENYEPEMRNTQNEVFAIINPKVAQNLLMIMQYKRKNITP